MIMRLVDHHKYYVIYCTFTWAHCCNFTTQPLITLNIHTSSCNLLVLVPSSAVLVPKAWLKVLWLHHTLHSSSLLPLKHGFAEQRSEYRWQRNPQMCHVYDKILHYTNYLFTYFDKTPVYTEPWYFWVRMMMSANKLVKVAWDCRESRYAKVHKCSQMFLLLYVYLKIYLGSSLEN